MSMDTIDDLLYLRDDILFLPLITHIVDDKAWRIASRQRGEMRLIERDNGAVIIPETEIKILIAATKPDPRVASDYRPTFPFFATPLLGWFGWMDKNTADPFVVYEKN